MGSSTSHETVRPLPPPRFRCLPYRPSFPLPFSSSSLRPAHWHAVPCSTSTGSLNVAIQDVPAGDDYYLLFIDSVHGVMYGTSSRFAVADSANGTTPTAASGAATVTISGGPNPTVGFATTFTATANAAAAHLAPATGAMPVLALASAMVACVLGGAWSVL